MNALPLLLLGGAALLMMGAGKKKTNGTTTNGTKTNGDKAANGYIDTVYMPMDSSDTVGGVRPGDKILVKAPKHPSGADGNWDVEAPDEVRVTQKSNREFVITAIKPVVWTPGHWEASMVNFRAVDPQTNDEVGEFVVNVDWAGEPPEGWKDKA